MRMSPQLISILGLMSRLTIVMPVLNEAAIIAGALRQLEPLRARGAEVIVVDGGSGDGTPGLAAPLADRDRKSTRLNSSHLKLSRMPSSA